MRNLLRAVRRLIERGLALLILIPGSVWIILVLLRGGMSPAIIARTQKLRRRWWGYLLRGFDDVRASFWPQYTLESTRDLWRYVLLMELFAVANVAAGPRHPTAECLPHGARVAVVRLGHIGDVLHSIPLLRSLKRQRPDISVDMIVGPWVGELVRRSCAADGVIEYAPHVLQYHRGRLQQCLSIGGEISFLRQLRQKHYDVVLCTSLTELIHEVMREALHPSLWIGVRPAGASMESSPEISEVAFDSGMYEAVWVSSFLARMGLSVEEARLEYPVTPEGDAVAEKWMRDLALEKGSFAMLAVGAGWPGKCWPPERFAEMADWLYSFRGLKVVLTGSAEEKDLSAAVLRHAKTSPLDLVGKMTLEGLASLLKQALLLVCNDCGALHIAAAVGTPTVSLFGPTEPSKWAPVGGQHVALRADYSCTGCWYWHPRARCLHDGECMKRIALADVQRAVERMGCLIAKTN